MSCKTKIIQGDDAILDIALKDRCSGAIFPLTGVTALVAEFPKADGTALSASGIIVSECLGQMSVTLSETETAELNPGEDQSFQVVIDQGPLRSTVIFEEALNVFPRLF